MRFSFSITAATGGAAVSISKPRIPVSLAFDLAPNNQTVATGPEQASINQDVATMTGKSYQLTFSSWFNGPDDGFIGVKINQSPVYTVDARDKNGPNVWNANSVLFVATGATTNIRFEFLIGVQ